VCEKLASKRQKKARTRLFEPLYDKEICVFYPPQPPQPPPQPLPQEEPQLEPQELPHELPQAPPSLLDEELFLSV